MGHTLYGTKGCPSSSNILMTVDNLGRGISFHRCYLLFSVQKVIAKNELVIFRTKSKRQYFSKESCL